MMERVRKIFQNRKKGLIKKASDLSILCDVKICMLIYNSDNNEPEIWPNNAADEVKSLIHNYKLAKENSGSTTTAEENSGSTTTAALGRRRSKKRAMDLTDINVKDNNTSEANKKTRKSAVGSSSSSSSSTVTDLWDGLNIDGLSKDQMFNLLSNLDRKIGGLQKRIDDRVAKKPYHCSSATPPLPILDLLATSSSSADDHSFQATTTTTYPPGYFQNMMIQSLQDDQLGTSNYPPGYFQNMMIQSDQELLEDKMMMSTGSSCQFSSFSLDHHRLGGGGRCCCDQYSDLAAELVKYKNIIPLLLESTYQL